MNKFYTRRTANVLTIAGWVFTIAAWPLPRPWDGLSAVTAIFAFAASLAIRSYLDGYERGQREKLRVEINRVWSEQEPYPINYSVPATLNPHALAADKDKP
jgi:hypothetical protein